MPASVTMRSDREDGLTLVEMLIAITVLGIMLLGVAAGMSTALNMTRNNEARGAAASLASREIESVQAMPFKDAVTLLGVAGPTTVTVGDVPFEVTRNIYWVGRTAPGGVCGGTTGAGDANFLRIDATVTWPSMGSIPPVVSETTLSPPVGLYNPNLGSLAVYVSDHQTPTSGVGGVSVTITGPTEAGTTTTTRTLTTGSDGCAIFDGLDAGTYDVSISKPGYIDIDQRVAPAVVDSQGVPAGRRAELQFKYAPKGKMRPQIQGRNGGRLPTTPLQVSLATTRGVTKPTPTGTSPLELEVYPDSYESWAGSCPDADPLGASDPTDATTRFWPSATRGVATQIPPTIPTTAITEIASLDVAWDAALDRTASYRLTAEHVGDCPNGVAVLDFGTVDLDDVNRLALPWGTWRLTLSQGGTVIADGTSPALDPARPATDPVPSVLVEPVPYVCTPQNPTFVGRTVETGKKSSSVTVTLPTASSAGDVAVLSVIVQDSPAWSVSTPGYAQARRMTGADASFGVFTRSLTSSGGTVTIADLAKKKYVIGVSVYRNLATATPSEVTTFANSAESGTILLPSLNAPSDRSLVVAVVAADDDSKGFESASSTYRERFDDDEDVSMAQYDAVFDAGPTSDAIFTLDEDQARAGVHMVFAPRCV